MDNPGLPLGLDRLISVKRLVHICLPVHILLGEKTEPSCLQTLLSGLCKFLLTICVGKTYFCAPSPPAPCLVRDT